MQTTVMRFNKRRQRSYANENAYHKFFAPLGFHPQNIPHDFATDDTLLTQEQEQQLFKALDYARYRASLQDNWEPVVHAIRSRLVNANLGIVFQFVKKTHGIEFDSLLSEAQFALLRAVDQFDPWRGFRFSTYVWRVISTSFYKLFHQRTRSERIEHVDSTDIEISDEFDENESLYLERLKRLLKTNCLTKPERQILNYRFISEFGLSYVASQMAISMERVRQLEQRAIKKLRSGLATDSVLQ